jgi:hypothetical protein
MVLRFRFNHLGITVTDKPEPAISMRVCSDSSFGETSRCHEVSSKTMMLEPPVGLVATYLWHLDLALNLMYFGAAEAQQRYRQRVTMRPGSLTFPFRLTISTPCSKTYLAMAVPCSDKAWDHQGTGALRCGFAIPRVSSSNW